MENRIAVLDLGTNTFHLLIAEGDMPRFTELVHLTEAVKLGEGGINDGIIRPEAYQRGIAAMHKFKKYINEYQPQHVKTMATSALRNAVNGIQFITEIKQSTGIDIETIDGDTEAGYIYQGIKAAECLTEGNNLIVDIGGGSIELIWCNRHEIFWKHSFEIGAARLMARFHQQDPMPEESRQELYKYLDEQLKALYNALENQHINTLIGSSGSFETFTDLLKANERGKLDWKKDINYTLNTEKLTGLFSLLARSSHAERSANPVIVPVRVDMIVVAALVTQYLIDNLYPNEIKASAFSLKEGVLATMLRKNSSQVA